MEYGKANIGDIIKLNRASKKCLNINGTISTIIKIK